MTNREIEDRLCRLQPAGPPSELRARVLRDAAAAPNRRRALDWLLPIAAGAAAVVLLALAHQERASLGRAALADPARGALVGLLTEQLGDDAGAQSLAARVADVDAIVEAPIE